MACTAPPGSGTLATRKTAAVPDASRWRSSSSPASLPGTARRAYGDPSACAVNGASPVQSVTDLPRGVRVQTEYPSLTRRFFERHGVEAEITLSYGATEAKIPEIADAVVEITETAIIEKPELWSMKLQQLRDLGLQIAIDDFGVGFASIAYLFRFQADYLKLDLSYSQRLHDSNVDALVQFLLSYGAHNDCRLILEGIETEEQLEVWSQQGVTLFQGYLFHDRIAVPCATTAATLQRGAGNGAAR